LNIGGRLLLGFLLFFGFLICWKGWFSSPFQMVIGERNKGSVQTDGVGTNLREAWKTLLWRTWEQC
jgi:hypothetical protein